MHRETDHHFDPEVPPSDGARPARWYRGERSAAGCRVLVVEGPETRPLQARTQDPLWSFSWGRSGYSARELAWSILFDSTHDAGLADDWCSAFTTEVIAVLPRDAFLMSCEDVGAWLSDERLAGATDRLHRRIRSRSRAANATDDRFESVGVELRASRPRAASLAG